MSEYSWIFEYFGKKNAEAGLVGGMGNTTAQSVESPGLNAAKVRQMARMLETARNIKDYVQPNALDLYGHDLPDQEQCYIIDRRAVHQELFKGLKAWQHDLITRHSPELDRKTVVVPRRRLQEIYFAMKMHGLDVRLEPRYGALQSESDGGTEHGK